MPDTKAKGVAFEDAQLDGAVLGKTAANSGTIGFYGKTPVVQRTFSSAVHVTSNVTTSASFGTSQLGVLNEIQNTLIGLGVWATS